MGWYHKYIFATLQDTRWEGQQPVVGNYTFERYFTVDKEQYKFYAEKGNNSANEDEWVAEFSLESGNGSFNSRYGPTNKNVALKVLSAVVNCFSEFIKNCDPEQIMFTSEGESRSSLYAKMLARYLPNLGYTVETSPYRDYDNVMQYKMVKKKAPATTAPQPIQQTQPQSTQPKPSLSIPEPTETPVNALVA